MRSGRRCLQRGSDAADDEVDQQARAGDIATAARAARQPLHAMVADMVDQCAECELVGPGRLRPCAARTGSVQRVDEDMGHRVEAVAPAHARPPACGRPVRAPPAAHRPRPRRWHATAAPGRRRRRRWRAAGRCRPPRCARAATAPGARRWCAAIVRRRRGRVRASGRSSSPPAPAARRPVRRSAGSSRRGSRAARTAARAASRMAARRSPRGRAALGWSSRAAGVAANCICIEALNARLPALYMRTSPEATRRCTGRRGIRRRKRGQRSFGETLMSLERPGLGRRQPFAEPNFVCPRRQPSIRRRISIRPTKDVP